MFSDASAHHLEVLPYDSKARRQFVTNGGLKRAQEIKADPGSAIEEYINNINGCFSEEIIRWEMSGKRTPEQIEVVLKEPAKVECVCVSGSTPQTMSVFCWNRLRTTNDLQSKN